MQKNEPLPVHVEKINMITEMLSSSPVNELWLSFVHLGNHNGSCSAREIAFQKYADARDLHLGLPKLIPFVDVNPKRFYR